MMRAPEFWDTAEGRGAAPLWRALLAPVSWIYQAGATVKAVTTPVSRASAPVICVGNLTMGGAGKTPVAIEILRRLRERGVAAHAVTRGYGGRKHGPVLVDIDKHSYKDVGDEALLLARTAPTWVAKSKPAGARAATKAGAEAIVLDDGFQNRSLHKDVSIVVIDAQSGLGNGRVFPAGPLRENARNALKRADAVVIASGGPVADKHAAWRNYLPPDTPVLEARLSPEGGIPAGPVFAFAGIARPQKFFDGLVRAGVEIKATATFPDHHPYSQNDINYLRDSARRANALLLTTEKDHVRLPRDLRRICHAWPVAAVFSDEAALDAVIERALDRAASRR